MGQSKYNVFISYSRSDYLDEKNNVIPNSAVDRIVKTLEQNEISYWIDVDGDNTSNQYMAKITKAIESSRMVLFVSSKRSNGKESYWPIQEVSLAGEKHKRVLPIHIDEYDYNDNIALILAGTDAIEYYKNADKSLKKLVLALKGEEPKKIPKNHDIKKTIIKVILSLIVLLGVFSAFTSIGFIVGYNSKHIDPEEIISLAFEKNQFTIIDESSFFYNGDKIQFTYRLDKCELDISGTRSRIFDNNYLSNAISSISLSILFSELWKIANTGGNNKYKAVIIIGGSISIFCGYGIGKPLGEEFAYQQNYKALLDYLHQAEIKVRLSNYCKEFRK